MRMTLHKCMFMVEIGGLVVVVGVAFTGKMTYSDLQLCSELL